MNKLDKAFECYQASKDKPANKVTMLLKKALSWFVVAFCSISMGKLVFYLMIFERGLTQHILDRGFVAGLMMAVLVGWLGWLFVLGGEKNEQ